MLRYLRRLKAVLSGSERTAESINVAASPPPAAIEAIPTEPQLVAEQPPVDVRPAGPRLGDGFAGRRITFEIGHTGP